MKNPFINIKINNRQSISINITDLISYSTQTTNGKFGHLTVTYKNNEEYIFLNGLDYESLESVYCKIVVAIENYYNEEV